MSYNLGFIDCPKLQTRLENIFACGQAKREQLPLTNFLFSDMNGVNVLQQNVSPANGKIRQVELVYTPRQPEARVSETIQFTCDGGDKAGELSTTYNLDETNGVYIKESMSLDDLYRRCESNDDYFARVIDYLLDALTRKLETKLATELVALKGKFATNDTNGVTNDVKNVQTITPTTEGVNYNALEEIRFTARQSMFCTAPVVLGEGEIVKYFDRLNAGSVWQGGIDFGQYFAQNPVAVLPTYRIPDALGSPNKFIVMSGGVVYPIYFNRYDPNGNTALTSLGDDGKVKTVIVDPYTGVPFDLRVTENCDVVTVELALAVQLVGLPSDLYGSDDRLFGVTGVHEFEVSNV